MGDPVPQNASTLAYKRVLLKVSGEALMGEGSYGIEQSVVARIADEIAEAKGLGAEICIVVGGGNIFRGVSQAASGMERASADYMGMLATVMNALALQNALEGIGMFTRIMSAIEMTAICEPYIRRRAVRHMEKGRIVIFAAGTGNPYFTTDTAAALRAAEMDCDALFKGTQVDGVYDDDPKRNPNAKRFETLTHRDVMVRDLKVMDQAAIALTRENAIPIIVFSIKERGGVVGALTGTGPHTTIVGE